MRKKRNEECGFTLIELMITLVVLAILLMLALPSFTSQIRNNRSLAFGEEFVTALNYVRSEAVKRGEPVSLCANDGSGACGASTDWTNGWIAFVDADPGGASGNTPTVGTELRIWDPPGDDMSLTVEDDGATEFVRFNRMGGLAGNDDETVTATAKHDECTGDAATEVSIVPSGSVRHKRADC